MPTVFGRARPAAAASGTVSPCVIAWNIDASVVDDGVTAAAGVRDDNDIVSYRVPAAGRRWNTLHARRYRSEQCLLYAILFFLLVVNYPLLTRYEQYFRVARFIASVDSRNLANGIPTGRVMFRGRSTCSWIVFWISPLQYSALEVLRDFFFIFLRIRRKRYETL